MPLFAFRAMTRLVVNVSTPETAQRVAATVADTLSGARYGSRGGSGVHHVDFDPKPHSVAPDALGNGYCCSLTGHVTVQAADEATARPLAESWRRIVVTHLEQVGLPFLRFDLYALESAKKSDLTGNARDASAYKTASSPAD
jgi:hypothetical protein